MYYFVFDLDETLAEVYSIFYFLLSLKLKNNIKAATPEQAQLLAKLDVAYNNFVGRILEMEKSDRPLGILRPGILGIMQKLSELKDSGQLAKVIIYSNNGKLENLEFVRDLIALSLGQPKEQLITDLIYYNSPGRNSEIIRQYNYKTGKMVGIPGAARKTWPVLQKIITRNGIKNLDFIPENVFFFDDLIPKHELRAELGDRYYQVPAYRFKASAERIAEIYMSIMRELGEDSEFNMNAYITLLAKRLLGAIPGNSNALAAPERLNILVNYLKHLTDKTVPVETLPPQPDTGISMMNTAIARVSAPPAVIANGSSGGKRTTTRRRARNSKTQAKKKLKWRP